mgnify:CR=1 FL=1
MSPELICLCVFVYLLVASVVYRFLGAVNPSFGNPFRFLNALFWPVFFLVIAGVFVITRWW